MTDYDEFSIDIRNTSDLVSARLKLRTYLLQEVKCTPSMVVRHLVALTAIGEFIINILHDFPIKVQCLMEEDDGELFARYLCKIPENIHITVMSQRAMDNFYKVVDKDDDNDHSEWLSGKLFVKHIST